MTFEEDVAYFKSIESTLTGEHKGKFVLVRDKTNIGIFSNLEDAHKEALKRFGVGDVVIAQIGTPQPLNYLATAL